MNGLLESLLSCIHSLVEKGAKDLQGFFEEDAIPSEESLNQLVDAMAVVCSVYTMFFKKSYFAGEEEYRFIFPPLHYEKGQDRPQFRLLDQIFLPYIMVELETEQQEIPLQSVMVGAKNNSDIAVRGMKYFLKAQGLAGDEVSSVSIDAYHSSVITHKNCKISKLKKNGTDLTFDYLAYALPYPLDSISRSGWGNKRSQRGAMRLVPFMEEFNQERFQVTNLEKGMYRLTIDNQFIDNLSSEKLANGVNLADYPNTPQYQQAAKIMYLNEERFEVEKRFREYLWTEYSFLKKEGLLFADDQKAIDKLKEYLPKDGFLRMSYDWYIKAMNPEIREVWSNYMKTIVETIYKINKPVTHKVRLTRIE